MPAKSPSAINAINSYSDWNAFFRVKCPSPFKIAAYVYLLYMYGDRHWFFNVSFVDLTPATSVFNKLTYILTNNSARFQTFFSGNVQLWVSLCWGTSYSVIFQYVINK